jgi:hypothetical protein
MGWGSWLGSRMGMGSRMGLETRRQHLCRTSLGVGLLGANVRRAIECYNLFAMEAPRSAFRWNAPACGRNTRSYRGLNQ